MKNLRKKYLVLVGLPVCLMGSSAPVSSLANHPASSAHSGKHKHHPAPHKVPSFAYNNGAYNNGDDLGSQYAAHLKQHYNGEDNSLSTFLKEYIDHSQNALKRWEKEHAHIQKGSEKYKEDVEQFAFERDQDHELAKLIYNLSSKSLEKIQHSVTESVNEMLGSFKQEEKNEGQKLRELLEKVGSNDTEIQKKLKEIHDAENQEQQILNNMHEALNKSDHEKHQELQKQLEEHRNDIAQKHQALLDLHHAKVKSAGDEVMSRSEHQKWISEQHAELQKRHGSLDQRIEHVMKMNESFNQRLDHVIAMQYLILRVFAGVLKDGGYITVDPENGSIHLTDKAMQNAVPLKSGYMSGSADASMHAITPSSTPAPTPSPSHTAMHATASAHSTAHANSHSLHPSHSAHHTAATHGGDTHRTVAAGQHASTARV